MQKRQTAAVLLSGDHSVGEKLALTLALSVRAGLATGRGRIFGRPLTSSPFGEFQTLKQTLEYFASGGRIESPRSGNWMVPA